MMFKNLDMQRRAASRFLLCAIWAFVPLVSIVMLRLETSWVPLTAAAGIIALLTDIMLRVSKREGLVRVTIAVALVAQISILVAALSGHLVQSDMHMAYFAGLAILAIYCDWRVIVAGAITIALHHLMLDLIYPLAIFADGADFGRVALHAVIVVIEAGALVIMSSSVATMFERVQSAVGVAQEAQHAAEYANNEASALRRDEAVARLEREAEQKSAAVEQQLVVSAIAGGLEQLAAGDLSFRLNAHFPGEYLKLRDDFNVTMEALQRTMRTIAGAVINIRSGTSEVSRGADDLARRTEQEATSLGECAAALEAITSTVKTAADGAQQTHHVVSAARSDVHLSMKVVQDAVAAVAAIDRSAKEISKIIGVIDEIASLTNLLALNAGVEAARAGEAGRGFAVVASEVRALAQRSTEAAREIKELVTASNAQVENGVSLVGETGRSLSRILTQVTDIDTAVANIRSSADEQAGRVSEINMAIAHMDTMTKQNVAMSEQCNAAMHSLAIEAQALDEIISKFGIIDELQERSMKNVSRNMNGRFSRRFMNENRSNVLEFG